MVMNATKIRRGLTLFGILVLLFNIYEYIVELSPRSEMRVVILECILGIGLIYLPDLIKKYFKILIPESITYFYWFFLFIAVFLGTCLHLIRIISGWDKLLHSISPMLLTAVGYGLIAMFLKKAHTKDVSIWLFLLFGFAFSGVCGVFWEFWEFLCDSVASLNLQRYISHGQELIGRAALMDTMLDMFTNTAGAIVMGIYAFAKSGGQPEYFESYRIRKIK
ncbi:hypothetical protein P7G51_03260 [Enterococcus asini]|uniref:hypothetical protein n=1 Tax=Enterococcus TaxID=1350 RepID=UPI002890E226|nr:hypothetical protein [Enterococcus asini]MDT2756399.1 hypothetical protein [Enterococcus asini]